MSSSGPEGNESVEWLNGTISKLWPQINADLFSTVVDLIEDVMQASLPPVVNQVKITSVGQGATPIRILSMRWLNEGGEGGAMRDWTSRKRSVNGPPWKLLLPTERAQVVATLQARQRTQVY